MHQTDDTDYFTVLGVEPSSPSEEITRAYRRLARQHHPDLHPQDAEADARFKKINEAYQALSDPEKRMHYDQQLAGSRPSPSLEYAQNPHNTPPPVEQQTSSIQREDIEKVEETIGDLAVAFQEIASQAAEEMRAALRDFGTDLDAISRTLADTVGGAGTRVNRASQRAYRPPPPQVRNLPPQNGRTPSNGRPPRDGKAPRS